MCGPQRYVTQCAALVKILTYFLALWAIWVGHSWLRQIAKLLRTKQPDTVPKLP